MSVLAGLALFGAGTLGGIFGTAGGITSLVTYPALLLVGLPALAANATNLLASVALLPGSVVASRPELEGKASALRPWAMISAVGALVGAGLLLSTPADAFARVVPYLLVLAIVALLLQPRLTIRTQEGSATGIRLATSIGVLLVSVYLGYFAAGGGVMMLAILLFGVEREVTQANALKNVLVGVASIVCAVTLVVFRGPVNWLAAAPLSFGMFLGATIGPRLARRVSKRAIRWLAIGAGLALALELLISGA
jgi:uncharacterized protein